MSPAPRQHHNLTLAILSLSALAFALLQTMVAPALPAIQQELGASPTSVSWVITVYLLTASIATPIAGRLGDMFGKERMLVAALGVFSVGLLVSALSNSLELLIAGRAIQGVAGAVFPLAIGIIRDEFPRERVATGIGLISATFGVGGGAGLVISGVLVDSLGYEWIFWLGLVVTLIAIVATHLFVPESPVKTPARIDWGGALLLSAALVAILLGVSEGNRWGWGDPLTLGCFLGGAALLIAWARYEGRVPEPMVDLALLRRRSVWTSNLTTFLMGFGMFGSFILIPLFVQTSPDGGYGFGVDTTGAGLFLLPSSIVMLVAGPLAGVLAGRAGGSRLPLLLGSICAGLSFALLAVAHAEQWEVVLAVAFMGLGIGLSFAAVSNLIVEAVPRENTGEATGINAIMRTVGGAIGSQVAAAIVTSHVATRGVPAEAGYTEAFAVAAIAIGFSLVAALFVPRPRLTPAVA